jgi:hypothetical protein
VNDLDTRDVFTDNELGPADHRRYSYLPTFILRALTRLHIEYP